MKKKIIAIAMTVLLYCTFLMTVFAETPQYKIGQIVEFSGQADFGYFYTYTDTDYTIYPYNEANYKCFSVVTTEGQRFYAAVKECQYEYCRAAFEGQDITLKGKYQQTAGDGSPVILIKAKITADEKGRKISTSVGDCAWAASAHGNTVDSTFKILHDIYSDVTITLSEDGSYLSIDTNPYNNKDSTTYNSVGISHIKNLNSALGLPEWLYKEMAQTRALDGRQKEEFDSVTVTWSYHPDQGLEVMYRKNA